MALKAGVMFAGGGALGLVIAAVLWGTRKPDAAVRPARDAAVVTARDAAVVPPPPPPPPPPRVTEGCVQLAGGTFTMGSPVGEGEDDERPQHTVTVAGFCIDRTEVTVGAYRACVAAGRCAAPTAYDARPGRWQVFCHWGRSGVEGHPINCVTQPQAEAYCAWRGGHLPTEDQWEFAARGAAGRRYPWGDAPEPSPQNSNLCGSECVTYAEALGRSSTGIAGWTDPWGGTAAVAELPRAGDTPDGLIGMAGNVWEWTRTPYGRYAARAGDATEDGGNAGSSRVVRGGAWVSLSPASARAAFRIRYDTVSEYEYVGFRCVTEGR